MIDMKKITANSDRPKTTKRKLDDMSAPALALEPGIKKKSGGGFTKIQDLAKKAGAEAGGSGNQIVQENNKVVSTKLAFSLPVPPVKTEPSKPLPVSNQGDDELNRADQEKSPLPQTPDIPDKPEETKVAPPSTIEISSDIGERDTNLQIKFRRKKFQRSGPLTEEQIGFGNDEDLEDYYNPRQPFPCALLKCGCGRIPMPKEDPADPTA